MKPLFLSFAALVISLWLVVPARCKAAGPDTLHVVNWNIEFFGDPDVHSSPAQQAAGVRKLMDAINADIYAVCEIVDAGAFAALVRALPGGYDYVLSPSASIAPSPSSPNYATAQKLALVYRTGLVRNLRWRAMLGSSSMAYYNFASGRLPFEVRAEVMGSDGAWYPLTFIVIHAKAYSDNMSCNRRIDACRELKDTLDKYYPATPFILLGDLNDDLDVSICRSMAESNYAAMVADSVRYKALTLPISRAGAFSIEGFSSLIDHVIVSDEVAPYYVNGSAEVLYTLARSVDSSFSEHISDHYPVRTKYVLRGGPTAFVAPNGSAQAVRVYPNPAREVLHVGNAGGPAWTVCTIYDLGGRAVSRQPFPPDGTLHLRGLNPGLYLLRLAAKDGQVARQMFRIEQ